MSLSTTGWPYSIALTLSNTNVDANQTNYVALITHNATSWPTAIITTGIKKSFNDGRDIRFSSDSLGVTQLAFDIIYFNNPTSEAYIWVKIPTLNSVASTIIYMWWGNSNATMPLVTDTYGRNNVYTSNSVYAKWQLSGATGAAVIGRTVSSWDGLNLGNPQSAVGKIYLSQAFDGTADRFDISGSGGETNFEGLGTAPPSALSVSAWIYITGGAGERCIIGKRDPSGNNTGWTFNINAANKLNASLDAGTNNAYVEGATVLLNNTWYYVTAIYGSTGIATDNKVLLNGVDNSSVYGSTITGNISTGSRVGIGSFEGNTSSRAWVGRVENVTFYNTTKAVSWFKAEYYNQNSVLAFISCGAVVEYSVFPVSWDLTKFITLTSNKDNIRSTQLSYISPIDKKQVEYVGKQVDFWASVQNGGGSLRLATGLDGSGILPLDVDLCDTALQLLNLFGKTTMTLGGGDVYYLFYKANTTVYQPIPNATYGRYLVHSQKGFVGRWHLSVQGTGVAGEYHDVSGTGNHGQGSVSPTRVRGISGYAQEGDGTTTKIVIGDTSFPIGAAKRTMWSWIYVGPDGLEDSGLCYGSNTSGNRVAIQQRTGGIGAHFSSNFRGWPQQLTGWHLVAVRVPNGITSTIDVEYVLDGLQIFPVNLAGTPVTLNTIKQFSYIGAAPGGAINSKLYDECGITTEILPNDWLYLDFKGMTDTNNIWGASVETNLDLLDELLKCCKILQGLIINNGKGIKNLLKQDFTTAFPKLYSIIADMKRDMLRGITSNRNDRREKDG